MKKEELGSESQNKIKHVVKMKEQKYHHWKEIFWWLVNGWEARIKRRMRLNKGIFSILGVS